MGNMSKIEGPRMRVQEIPVYWDCPKPPADIIVVYTDNTTTGCAGVEFTGPPPLEIRLCEEFVGSTSATYGITRSAQFSVTSGTFTGGHLKRSIGTTDGYVAGDILTFTTDGELTGITTPLLPPGTGFLNLYIQYAVMGGIVTDETPSVEFAFFEPTSSSGTNIDVTISEYVPQREGYTFTGWLVSGVLYGYITDGQVIQPSQRFQGPYNDSSLVGLLLQAQWE